MTPGDTPVTITATAPDLSPAEADVVARFDAAPDAEEALRARVADAIWRADSPYGGDCPNHWVDIYRNRARAAIAAVRGEGHDA